jgi:hypothetical protein
MSLNGLSPRRSNRRLGFELMKMGAGCSGSAQNAPPNWSIVNPEEAARAVRTFAARGGFCGARRIARPKSASKRITAVDNAMTLA